MDGEMSRLRAALQGESLPGIADADVEGGAFPGMEKAENSSDDGMDEVAVKGKGKTKKSGFAAFNLKREISRAVQANGFVVPTPIQRKAIPVQMEGNDVVAMARTGSGKTAAYLIPLLHKLGAHSVTVGARAIILSPTRELAIQILKVAKQLSRFMDLRYCVIVGGLAISEQFTDLAGNPDVLIGSPGRLLHIVMEADIKLKRVETVILDEADRLFETGSLGTQVNDLLKRLPDSRQISLFSATLPAGLADFADAGLHNPKVIRLDSEVKISDKLALSFLMTRREEKLPALLYVLRELVGVPENKSQTLIFVPTKHHGELIHQVLDHQVIDHAFIHGSMDQEAKTMELERFSNRKTYIMIVTDVAARGIDIPMLDNVINFEFPDRPKLFIHRVGRAARAGRSGKAYSIITKDELPHVLDLHLFLGKPMKNELQKREKEDMEEEEEEEEEETKEKKDSEEEEVADGYFGTIPPNMLDEDTQALTNINNNHTEVVTQAKTCDNAFKLYWRTRKGATSESIKKARMMYDSGIKPHPIFNTAKYRLVDMETQQGKEKLMQCISHFRPAVNIFDSVKQGIKGIMAAGRQTDFLAPKVKTRGERRKEKLAMSLTKLLGAPAEDQKPQGLKESLLARVGTQTTTAPKRTREMRDAEREKEKAEFYIPYTKDQSGKYDEMGYSVNELKDAVLDVTGDSNEGMIKQRQVYVWKAKTNRYVKMNMNDAKMNLSKTKNEAGKKIEFKKGEQGKLLKKWEKKTNARIQAAGEEEDPSLYDPKRRNKRASAMADDEIVNNDEEDHPAKKQKLGRKGKKNAAIKSAEVKSFSTLQKEKKQKAIKSAKFAKQQKGSKKGGGKKKGGKK